MKKAIGICICMLAVLVLFGGSTLSTSDVQNDSCDTGWYTSLALDKNDNPHISYYDYENGDLKYCRWDGMGWDVQIVDSDNNVGRYTSLVLDGNGFPHISYYDYSKGNLKYCCWNGTSWEITSVDRAGKMGLFSCIALDNDDRPHISYVDFTNHFLKYAFLDDGEWVTEKVDEEAGRYEYFSDTTSIAIDSFGHPHISYCRKDDLDLRYAYFDGVSWEKETVDAAGDVGQYSSIVLDSDDNPHISYASWTDFNLKYAQKEDGRWNIDIADMEGDVRKWTSIDLDLNGKPHISYYDYTEGALKYVFFDGGRWHREFVDREGSTGCFNSICLTSDDRPCISYYDWGCKTLKYASLVDGRWSVEAIEVIALVDFIDQEQTYCSGYGSEINSGEPVAQSFIPTSPVLSRVELMIVKRNNPGGFTVSIRENLDGEDLTSVSLSSKEVAEDLSWKMFNIPDIDVVPGQTYYIVCTSENTGGYNLYYWYIGHGNPYENGEGWIFRARWQEAYFSWLPYPDMGFRTYGYINEKPSTPRISGENSGETGVEYSYDILATDENNDDIRYEIEWGIGESILIGPYLSGETVTVKHTWSEDGEYIIRVKAIDIHGAESDWSTLKVRMPKNKVIGHPVLRFLEKHSRVFSMLKQLSTCKCNVKGDIGCTVMSDPYPLPNPSGASPKPVIVSVPNEFSWKNYNGEDWTTPVRHQGDCGSCWGFAAIGTLESIINIREGYANLDSDLSEQYLLSCLSDAGSCHGGSPSRAFAYMMDTTSQGNYHNGALLESCFCYGANDEILCSGKCSEWENMLVPILDWGYWLTDGSPEDIDVIKNKVMETGPVTTFIMSTLNFSEWGRHNHSSEDYYSDDYSSRHNHCVIIVGWKDDSSIDRGGYWICKNSWGTQWGYDGFFNIEYGSSSIDNSGIIWVDYDPESFAWPPIADHGGPYVGDVGQEILFDASTSSGIESDIVSYEWDFGDSSTGTGINPIHVYLQRGTYGVMLTVTDESGRQTTEETVVVINLWVKDNSWTYKFDNIFMEMEQGELITCLQGAIENLVLTVTDDTDELYDLNFNGDIEGKLDISFNNIDVSTRLSKSTKINGNILLTQAGLGIEEINAHIKGTVIASINILPIPIPIPFDVDVEMKFDECFELIDFPLDVDKTWNIPSTSVSVDGKIKSPMLTVLNIINRMSGRTLLPPQIGGLLPVIDIGEALEEFNIGNPLTVPGIQNVKCISERQVSVEAGTYNAYEIDIYSLINYYYAPEVGNIIKISMGIENFAIPYGELTFVMEGELVSTNYDI